MQFLLVAVDDTEPEVPVRRAMALADHALLIGQLKGSGNFTMGGHTLDDKEKIIGSAMILDFPSREGVDAYLKREPYAARGVWKTITVTRLNLG